MSGTEARGGVNGGEGLLEAGMKKIEIDIDVNRRIEGARASFEEDQNDILRRLLGIDVPLQTRPLLPRVRAPRSSGAYSTLIGTLPIEANSLKELLRASLLACAKTSPGFLDALSRVSTRRGRHIIARSPQEIYPQSPQLAEYAEKLDGNWWFDTNVGREQVAGYLRTMARLARLSQLPVISKRSQKTALTLEDFSL
jgi:hypothetical protein